MAEALSPFVTVAKIRGPTQDISGPDNLQVMDALSFTPWRVTADHAPLGRDSATPGRRSTDVRRSRAIGSTVRTGVSPERARSVWRSFACVQEG